MEKGMVHWMDTNLVVMKDIYWVVKMVESSVARLVGMMVELTAV